MLDKMLAIPLGLIQSKIEEKCAGVRAHLDVCKGKDPTRKPTDEEIHTMEMQLNTIETELDLLLEESTGLPDLSELPSVASCLMAIHKVFTVILEVLELPVYKDNERLGEHKVYLSWQCKKFLDIIPEHMRQL